MLKKQENKGVVFILLSAAMWGIFPVVINRGTQTVPPVTFAAAATLLAAFGSFLYAASTNKLHELKKKEVYFPLFMVAVCIIVIPYILFFIGASKTSGINSSLLLLSEIIFALIFTPFIGEKTTIEKLIGVIAIFIGAAFILYNGKFQLNIGDLLIIMSTMTYPVGNFYSKKALNFISPAIILFVRSLLGGLFILIFALLTESQSNMFAVISANWILILFTGLVLFVISKIIWYEGLKHLDVSKATALGMTFPLFSLVVLIAVFKEIPSMFQFAGIVIMAIGVYLSIKRRSVNPALTKYAP